ncbi:MAG TPA: hypothetical protein VES42_17220, partial [Pilimelia sp.]|nr:hypothetical protein [Pilimelia sp.]
GLGIALVPLLFLPATVVGEAAARGGRLPAELLVAFALAATLATMYVAVVAVATDAPRTDTVVACLIGAAAVLGPTAAGVGVAHGVRRVRPFRRPAVPVEPRPNSGVLPSAG